MSALQKYKKEATEAREALADAQAKLASANEGMARLREERDWLLLLHVAPVEQFNELSAKFLDRHPQLAQAIKQGDPMFFAGLRFSVLGERG